MNRKAFNVLMIIFWASLMGCTGFFAGMNVTVSRRVAIRLDFSSPLTETITSSWGSLNIFDLATIRHRVGINYTGLDFVRDHPSTTTIVLMSATGGRVNKDNDYVTRVNGTLVYNFTNLDMAIDWIASTGLHLEFVFGNTPHALIDNESGSIPENGLDYGEFSILTHPPGNYTEYGWYIGNITQHCIDRWTLEEVNTWEFRLMTEPDNQGWWTGTVEEYIENWMVTFSTVMTLVPNASLVLGNMAYHDEFTFTEQVLQGIHARDPSLLPDTISFSYYHNLRRPENPHDLSKLIQLWNKFLGDLQLGKSFSLSCEEGQILHDEEGTYLWSGDGTELGGAWQAWMISSCVGTNFKRFSQWDVQHGGLLAPKGFVQLMADRTTGSKLVPITMPMPSMFLPASSGFTNMIGGYGAADDINSEYRAFLYQYVPFRDWALDVDASIALAGLEEGTYHFSIYAVDHDRHNWFTQWLQDSSHMERVPSASGQGGSIYDLNIGATLGYTEGWIFWWQWSHNNTFSNDLVPMESRTVSILEGGSMNLDVSFPRNCVYLIELIKV